MRTPSEQNKNLRKHCGMSQQNSEEYRIRSHLQNERIKKQLDMERVKFAYLSARKQLGVPVMAKPGTKAFREYLLHKEIISSCKSNIAYALGHINSHVRYGKGGNHRVLSGRAGSDEKGIQDSVHDRKGR
ncbi:hypothetical protein [Novibacillus thermophilus]|uniref:hypothetical protein n=1 Tax=Novibacillus thermophilus TaxID=1471761 RepID=UPI001474B62B|nr:hypothetical protein [Novibacillus thermophilus]